MAESKKLTIDEQIANLTQRLATLKAKKATISRKDRNGELMALGITLENQFADAPEAVKLWLEKAAESQADERTKKRALSAISRLNIPLENLSDNQDL